MFVNPAVREKNEEKVVHPVLIKIGALEIRSYGLMLALSFLIGIYIAARRARSRNIDPNHIMDLSVVIIISAIVGSRLLYVLFHLDEFRGHWLDTINPFQSSGQIGIAGLTMLGGVILAFISSILYIRRKKLPLLPLADTIMPAVAFGIFLTRIGCHLNGCCYGLPCHGPLCVVFPPESAAGSAFQGVPLVPTQLISSGYGLLIFASLLLAERFSKRSGLTLYLFLILYGFARFVIDFFRYYESSMVLIEVGGTAISLNQGISLLFIAAGIVMLVRKPPGQMGNGDKK